MVPQPQIYARLTYFTPASCEVWKTGALEGDTSDTDRTTCWSWIDELYYAVITYATIGYGDVTPKSKAGKLFGAVRETPTLTPS